MLHPEVGNVLPERAHKELIRVAEAMVDAPNSLNDVHNRIKAKLSIMALREQFVIRVIRIGYNDGVCGSNFNY